MLTPLLLGGDGVAVEVSGSLLELGEVLDRLQGPLGTEETLNVDAAQRGRLDPVPELLGPNVTDEVGGAVRVPVYVTVEAGHAEAGPRRARRSSVALNCCCGKGVTSRRSPSSCLGFSIPSKSS